ALDSNPARRRGLLRLPEEGLGPSARAGAAGPLAGMPRLRLPPDGAQDRLVTNSAGCLRSGMGRATGTCRSAPTYGSSRLASLVVRRPGDDAELELPERVRPG